MRLLAIAVALAGVAAGSPPSRTWDSLGLLKSGALIEVISAGRAERGEFVSMSSESLTIRRHGGESKFSRPDVERVVSRDNPKRLRNFLIGVGVGAAIGFTADRTVGAFLRNEGDPANVRALIWTIPIVACGAIGAAYPAYTVLYRK